MAAKKKKAKKQEPALLSNKKREEALDRIEELTKLLQDRISETHQIKGQQANRHAFILYRDELQDIRDLLR